MSAQPARPSRPWPEEIRYRRSAKMLSVSFDNGTGFDMPAEFLRIESPSAEVQGHGSGQKQTVPGKKDVSILTIEPVGHYAVRLVFDDGHDTGLYSWDTLHRLGSEQEALWADYLKRLEDAGLSRDRP